jgi:hypothetical protein
MVQPHDSNHLAHRAVAATGQGLRALPLYTKAVASLKIVDESLSRP